MIYTIGEIVLDVICRDFNNIIAKPGGSILNTAITLGRLRQPVEHISYLSTDKNGKLIINFLQENGVGSSYIYSTSTIKTNLAFAHLDEQNNAHYTFYKDDLTDYRHLMLPLVQNGDILLYGSFFSLNPKIREVLVPFLEKSRKAGALLMYDPNFREPHKPMLPILKPHIEKNMRVAHLVKASNEDFYNVFGIDNGAESWELVKSFGGKALIYTKGKDGAELFDEKEHLNVAGKNITTLSTIGAGDTFSAGIIYGLYKQGFQTLITQNNQPPWEPIISLANQFAAEVCTSYENYISTDFIKQLHV